MESGEDIVIISVDFDSFPIVAPPIHLFGKARELLCLLCFSHDTRHAATK